MAEAYSHLKLLPTSILDIYKVFEHIDMLSIGIQNQQWMNYQFDGHKNKRNIKVLSNFNINNIFLLNIFPSKGIERTLNHPLTCTIDSYKT